MTPSIALQQIGQRHRVPLRVLHREVGRDLCALRRARLAARQQQAADQRGSGQKGKHSHAARIRQPQTVHRASRVPL